MKKILMAFTAVLAACALYAAPAAPAGVFLTFDGSNIDVEWQGITSTAASYNVLRAGSESGPYTVVASGLNVTKYTDALPDTTSAYFYAVQADISGDTSPASAAVRVYPYPPHQAVIKSYNSRVYLSWSPVNAPQGVSYRVYKSSVEGKFDSGYVAVTSPELLDDSVINGQRLYYMITSVTGTAEGARSVVLEALPFAPPHSVKAFAASVSQSAVNISWSKDLIEGTYPVESFNIYRGSSLPVEDSGLLASVTYTAYTDNTASAGILWYYRINAVDTEGNTSLPSFASAYIRTNPSAPQGLEVTSDGASAYVTWAAGPQEESVTQYEIYKDSVLAGNSSQPYFQDSAVVLGNSYCYEVIAVNSEGSSAASAQVCADIKPSAPAGLTAERPAEGEVTVTWQAVSGGSAIDGYNLYRADSSGVFPVTAQYEGITYTSVNENSLTPGELYYYKAAAVSSGIEGYMSLTISVRPVSAPAEPTGFTANAYSGYAVLEWDADTQYDVTSYSIYRGTSLSASAMITTTAGTEYYDSTLINGTVYTYRLSASNIFGSSNTLTALAISVTPQAGVLPSAPQNVTAVSAGDGTIALSWDRIQGSASKYKIYRSSAPASGVFYKETTSTALVDSLMNTSMSWTLTNTGTYYYTVRAVDAYGAEGAASTEVSQSAFLRPGGVTDIDLTDLNGRVLVRWEAPAEPFTHGPAVTYSIYRSSTGAEGSYSLRAQGVTTLFYEDSHANTASAVLYYKVKSVDALSNEDLSFNDTNSINVTPVLSGPSVLAARAGSGRVTLVWTVMTPQSFNVYRKTTQTAGGFGYPIAYAIGFNSKEYQDVTVMNGVEYIYSVAAVNSAGEGPKSMTVSAVPYEAPKLDNGNTLNAVVENKKDVSLTWNEAVQGTYAITGYRVLRSADNGGSFSFLTHTAGTAYYDASTQWDNRYIYRVLVVDAKNNTDTAYRNAVVDLPKPGNKIRVFANLVDFSKGESLKLRYFTVQKGKVKLSIKTLSGLHVGTIAEREHEEELSPLSPFESDDFFWNGKNREGRNVAPGVYLIMLEAGGERVVERVAVVR